MFHYKLIELEAELAAKEQAQKGFDELPPACTVLVDYIEQQVGARLGDPIPKDWKGWLSYRRREHSLVICRGRAFKVSMFDKYRSGLDVSNGADSIRDYQRSFDVSPPQDLDHLLTNFGGTQEQTRVFLWYGENIAPYKLIFAADLETEPHEQLSNAIIEACTWVMKRPKSVTLTRFLHDQQQA
jgi:hypothetical protein